jgi:hypothetical protein
MSNLRVKKDQSIHINIETGEKEHYSNRYVEQPIFDEDKETDDLRRYREYVAESNERPY